MKNILQKLTRANSLEQSEIDQLIFGLKEDRFTPTQIAGFLMGLVMKGPTTDEISYIAQAMRRACVTINPQAEKLTDTCGTGGGLTTFNVSSANSLVSAAAGVNIAKHGSRSISSSSGSADVLEALGIEVEIAPTVAEKMIEEHGFAFLYAPFYHPVMLKVFGPENDLGIKTIFFTIIGPLINPAGAKRHLLGVYRPELVDQVARVIADLDFEHVMVVHGVDGLDEISLIGETRIAEVVNGIVKYYTVKPEDFGLKRCSLDDVHGGSPDYNAQVIMDIFEGRDQGPRRDKLILNTAATLVIADKAGSIHEGLEIARQTIDSGKALAKLREIQAASQVIREAALN
ncbi:MAG: anthranilate phosphoribosyltransferase [Chitinophagales bacterium]